MRRLLFTGSFNPFTTGHADIARRALALADELIIAVGFNGDKPESRASAAIRVEQINGWARRTDLYPAIRAEAMTGLAAVFAEERKCQAIVRGVRNAEDFLYEYNMACANRRIAGIETILIPTDPALSFISSSMVRELDRFGYDTAEFLP